MKKFLIGIVTLVAAVMFTSPAFGALTGYEDGFHWWEDEDVGKFYFDVPLAVEPLPNPLKITDLGPPVTGAGSDAGYDMVHTEWGAEKPLIVPVGDVSSASGHVVFDPGVQIIVAGWGGPTQYGFLFDGYTNNFKWDYVINDRNGELSQMSHVDGYSAVPVPAAVWLLGSGVLGLVAIRRRRS